MYVAAAIVRWIRGEEFGVETLIIDEESRDELDLYLDGRLKRALLGFSNHGFLDNIPAGIKLAASFSRISESVVIQVESNVIRTGAFWHAKEAVLRREMSEYPSEIQVIKNVCLEIVRRHQVCH